MFGPVPSALDYRPAPRKARRDRRAQPRKRILVPRAAKTKNAISQAFRVVEGEQVVIPEIRVAEIIEFVAQATGVGAEHIRGPSHEHRCTWPRQIAMALALGVTKRQLVQIAKVFNRNHATVLHAQKSVRRHCERFPAFAVDYENWRLTLATFAAQRLARLAP